MESNLGPLSLVLPLALHGWFGDHACGTLNQLRHRISLNSDVIDCFVVSNALQGIAAKLPGDTRVFCGHEYTVSNLQFAKHVEPKSVAISEKLEWSRGILANGGYTVPSTASLIRYTPFVVTSFNGVQQQRVAKRAHM